MEQVLKLYHSDGANARIPFPSTDEQICIGNFTFNAQRMGAAPRISATLMYPTCLDDVWDDSVYTEFRGERYFLMKTPSSSKDSSDARYKHEIELVSERVILDNIYFYDVVQNSEIDSKPASNGTRVFFFGNIVQFSKRLQHSLEYSHVGYTVILDLINDSIFEEKLITFENQFFSNALQEVYNTFNVPYYFQGKEIHIGKYQVNDELDGVTFKYGSENNLMSVSRSNVNNRVVNMIAPEGSSENIPYYYPNETPYGDLSIKNSPEISPSISDYALFSSKVTPNDVFIAKSLNIFTLSEESARGNGSLSSDKMSSILSFSSDFRSESNVLVKMPPATSMNVVRYEVLVIKISNTGETEDVFKGMWSIGDGSITKTFSPKYDEDSFYTTDLRQYFAKEETELKCYAGVSFSQEDWILNERTVSMDSYGIDTGPIFVDGAEISVISENYINPVGRLMPPIYREKQERFYKAVNQLYKKEDGSFYEFINPYNGVNRNEYRELFEDIKPTLKGLHLAGIRIDQIADIAFDENDNNDTIEKDNGIEYVHPYFFVKLRRTVAEENGIDYSFNLFNCAIEGKFMTVNFTSGSCAGYVFEVGVDEKEHKYNTVQVDERTNELLRYKNGPHKGDVICGRKGLPAVNFQKWQQDTTQRETWIALKKDIQTNDGQIMPDYKKGFYPTPESDTFVITNIKLPKAYILAAEKRLESAAIEYMYNNNSEKFNFSIKFSRIYLNKHKKVLESISENSRVFVEYNGRKYELYVTSYSYAVNEDDVIPEVKVDLKYEIAVVKNSIENAINEVKQNLILQLAGLDIVGICKPHFISKNKDDFANGSISFNKKQKFLQGLELGDFVDGILDGRGGSFDKNGNAQLESLKVRSALIVKELIYNRWKAQESNSAFTECGVIEATKVREDGTIDLFIKKRWDNDLVAFSVNDICFGSVNNLKTGGVYYDSWFRILNVSISSNSINVLMYPDPEVPSKKNYMPTPGMVIARRGNAVDTSRQSFWYISSEEGCICMLDGVTKPILEQSNYSIIIGKLKRLDIFNNLPINYMQSYVYCRGIATQDIWPIDYEGTVIARERNRGFWSLETANSKEPYRTTKELFDSVSHVGCEWRCIVDKTKEEPKYASTGWAMIRGNPEFSIDIESSNGWFFDLDRISKFNEKGEYEVFTTLKITGKMYNQDVTDSIRNEDIEWFRDTGNPTEDNAWAAKRAAAGKELSITLEDLGNDYINRSSCSFRAVVLLRDGNEIKRAQSMVAF